MSIGGGVHRAIERSRSIDCTAMQIFVKNNMQWFGKPYVPHDLALYVNELAAQKFHIVFGHTGYLINLGAPAGPNRDNSIKSLIQEFCLGSIKVYLLKAASKLKVVETPCGLGCHLT